MSSEAETDVLYPQRFVDRLQETIVEQEKQISQWREVAILEGIALLLTIYFYVL